MYQASTPKQKRIEQALDDFPYSSPEELTYLIGIPSAYIEKIADKLGRTSNTRPVPAKGVKQKAGLYPVGVATSETTPDKRVIEHNTVRFSQVSDLDSAHAKRDSHGRSLHPITRCPGVSVSDIVDLLDKPALKFWAAKLAAEEAIERPYNPQIENRNSAIRRIAKAFQRTSKQSRNRGTNIHQYIEKDTPLHDVKEELRGYVAAAKQAITDLHITPILQEANVHGTGYLGKTDMVCKIGENQELAVLEWKTTTKDIPKIWPESLMQVAAYANADVIAAPAIGVVYMPYIDVGATICLANNGRYASLTFPVSREGYIYQQFLLLLQMYLRRSRLDEIIQTQSYTSQAVDF